MKLTRHCSEFDTPWLTQCLFSATRDLKLSPSGNETKGMRRPLPNLYRGPHHGRGRNTDTAPADVDCTSDPLVRPIDGKRFALELFLHKTIDPFSDQDP